MLRRLSFFLQIKRSIPFLIEFFQSHQVSPLKKGSMVVLFLAYLLFPFDLIPDVFPVAGFLDEVALLGVILNYIVKTAPQDLRKKFNV